jgi:hypothetical protein
MLNIDVAIARDLENNIDSDGMASCSFLSPAATKCPLASTLSKAHSYGVDNTAWLKDFKIVLTIMLEKGL